MEKRKGNCHGFIEKNVYTAVENALYGDSNIAIHRVNTGAAKVDKRFIRFGVPGQSDFSGIIKEIRCPICNALTGAGVRLEIECKGPKGRLSDHQKAWVDKINEMNGIAIVFHPKTVDELFVSNVRKVIQDAICKPCAKCASTGMDFE